VPDVARAAREQHRKRANHPNRDKEKRMLIMLAAAAAAFVIAPQALAAPSPTLEGEQLAATSAADVESRCYYDVFGRNAAISFRAAGTASGSYAGTFAAGGTARISYRLATLDLTEFAATFSIASPAGSLKGTIGNTHGRTSGTGTCNASASDGTIDATGLVYTLTLPDGTIDQGIVALSLVDDSSSGRFGAAFHSTSRIADMDLDGVVDGLDNCPIDANADQFDLDDDGAGDACDLVDNRADYFNDLVAGSRAAAITNALITKADHARTAYFNRDVPAACTDLAAYVDGVLARRGKTIASATADALVAQGQRIRKVIGCR
jgi:heat shock protein HslJ